MNRLLSILVSLVVIFFLYLWISHLSTSPKYMGEEGSGVTAEEAPIEKEVTAEPLTPVEESTTIEEADDESFETGEDQVAEEKPAEEKPVETKPPLVVEEEPPPTPSSEQAAASSGPHWVIAGNFLELANAEKHMRRMKELGYSQTEIVHFELSEYHTVCAGKFQDPTEARRVARKITELHGIDTYVRQVNQ